MNAVLRSYLLNILFVFLFGWGYWSYIVLMYDSLIFCKIQRHFGE
ncbi:hypothetical protein ACFQDF_02270 [Ectobacillus funiculus]